MNQQTMGRMACLCAAIPWAGGALAMEAVGKDVGAAEQWMQQVRAAECGFAASMARRDLAAFERYLAEHTLFFNGRGEPIQGRAAVVAAWRGFYDGAQAPFSWEPDQIVVSGDGRLAYSTGPVRDAQGQALSRFNSVWYQEAPGRWLIVIDRGAPLPAAERLAPAPAGKGCEGVVLPG